MSCVMSPPGAFTLGYQGVQGTVHSHAQASKIGTSCGFAANMIVPEPSPTATFQSWYV